MYKCKSCNWEGTEEELDVDQVETCFGNDEIPTCPNCGQLNVVRINS